MRKIAIYVYLIITFSGSVIAQGRVEPTILRTLKPLKVRNNNIEKAIRKFGECDNSIRNRSRRGCSYIKFDLNGDKIPEVVVYSYGSEFCGTSGCDTFILQLRQRRYKLITHIEPARVPIIVSTQKTKGWNDLIIFVSGGGIFPAYWSVSKFDGRTYPENSTVEEKSPRLRKKVRGTKLDLD